MDENTWESRKMSNPHEILERLKGDEKQMTDINKRLESLNELMEMNGYTGKYRPLFGKFYGEILQAKAKIVEAFSDGFQLGDLEKIFSVAAPILKGIYTEAVPLLKEPSEAEVFLKELVIFVYGEIEPLIKSSGLLKFFFRIFLRIYIAGKIAKYLKYAFDKADGVVNDVMGNKFVQKAQKFVDAIGD